MIQANRKYKKTEVGVIPEDWEVKSLGDLFSFSGGFTASRDQLSNEGHCYLHYGDIHKSNKTYIDVSKEYYDIPKLNVDLGTVSKKSILDDGDVVFVDASEDDEGTSKHIVVRNSKEINYISGLHTIVAKSKDDSVDNTFKQFCFQTRLIKKQFLFYSVGTKVSGISKTNIPKILIAVPSTKGEQSAIAVTLNDTDELISQLDALLNKKKGLKQGAMQELLTGKKRLPGFSGEWETKKLGDVADVKDGTHQTPTYVDSGVPFYSVESVTRDDFRNTKFISEFDHAILSKNNKIEKGDILMTRIGSIGDCKYINWNADASYYVSLALLKIKNEYSAPFIAYYSHSSFFKKEIELNSLQSAIPKKINLGQISLVQLRIPPTKEEQSAIAQVLSDMDAEIEQLEQKLDKYKQIKQGMMQELLTGKTRLVSVN